MSGGAAVKAGGGVEGDHPVCTEQRGGRPGTRPAGARMGLALTARGPQAPLLQKSGCKPRTEVSRRLGDKKARGIVTVWPRRLLQAAREATP